ncbi:MAG TPA: BatD family protein [bacterium]|nr:BatD family protein [bacterium]HPN36356.1 BatD family protein [bacterium]
MHRRALWLGLTLVAASYVRSQTTIAPALPAEGIRVSAFAEQSTVPLNRTVPVTIRLEWQGDLDRYEIIEVENLTAQNFEVVGNSSANRVAVVDGRNLSVHDFQYTLRPMSLGMGYVNGLTVRYADAGNGKQYRLFTNRVEIRVVDPVAEPGAHDWLYYLAAALLLLAALVYVFVKLQKKKKQEAEKALALAQQQKPIEERYLEQLRTQIPLDSRELDTGEALSRLSRLLRRYWSEKHGLPGLEATSEEFLAALHALPIESRAAADVAEVIRSADLAKFSGTGIDRPTLERLYTLFEFQLSSSTQKPQSM